MQPIKEQSGNQWLAYQGGFFCTLYFVIYAVQHGASMDCGYPIIHAGKP